MSDVALRELERRWRETGVAEDGRAYLTAAVRAGALEAWRVELAAYVGEPASLEVVPRAPATPERLEDWVQGLVAWGRPALVRGLVALGERLLRTVDAACSHDGPVEGALAAARAWCRHPCPALAHPAQGACGAAIEAAYTVYGSEGDAALLGVARVAARACLATDPTSAAGEDGYGSFEVGRAAGRGQDELRRAVRDDVARWALGGDDPFAPTSESPSPPLRRWRASGHLEDEVAYLRVCLGTGELSDTRLRLAGLLGCEAARAVGPPVRSPVPPDSPQAFEEWVSALASCGAEASVRAALVLAERLTFPWPDELAERREALSELREAMAAWTRCPCARHAEAARRAGLRVELAADMLATLPSPKPQEPPDLPDEDDDELARVVRRTRELTEQVRRDGGPRARRIALAHASLPALIDEPRRLSACLARLRRVPRGGATWNEDVVAELSRDVGAALLPWALGYV